VPGAAGGLYHVTDGEEVTCRELIDALAGALELPLPRRSVPFPVLYAVAALLELAARAAHRAAPPPLTRYGVRLVASDCRYDIDKARRELGYRPLVGLRDGVARLGASRGDAPRGQGG
jgi:nucleoside-diphosphate-sugar epimerase